MTELVDLTLTQALQKLRGREITATELTRAYLDRIEKFGDELNCYITRTPERALADAAESDKRYAAGTARALEGIPIGMKDLFGTFGIRTTAGSHILDNFIPQYESTISQRIKDAGTVLLGKTNLDEFAMGTTSSTSYFGAPINPYQRSRKLTPGGSSGGSTSAVAAGLALAATGTDTGGSIRFPAAITGLVGMKPTYGVCSRYGCIAFASSLDHPGPVARTVDDAALMLSVMAGHDPHESTSAPNADDIANDLKNALGLNCSPLGGSQSEAMVGGQNIDRPPTDALHASTPPEGGVISLSPIPLKGLRIGVIKEFADVEISADMKRIMDEHLRALEMKGAELITVSIPNILDALAAYYIIAPAEASSNLARYDGMRYGLRVDGRDLIDTYKKTRAAGFGTEVQRRMVVGTAVLSSESYEVYFMQAARVRRLIDEAFTRAFGQCDLIICPASAGPAFPLSDELSPLDAYALDLFTVAMDLSGLPACSVPAGMSGGVACPPSGGGLSAEPTGGGSVLDSKNSPPSPPSAVLPPKGGETRLPLGLQVVGRRFDDVRVLQLAKHIEAASALDNRPTKVMGE